MSATESSVSTLDAWPPCARPIFVVGRSGYPVEPAELASSWRQAELRREGTAEISTFDLGLTPAEKRDLAKVGIAVIPLPFSRDSESPVSGDPSDDWNPPVPFHRVDVAPFPVEVLPDWVADYARAVAEFSQTPADLAGLLGLAAMSAAARGAFDIEAPFGHREPMCLYLAAVLPPGERKSSVFQSMVEPIVGFEASEAQRLAPQIAEEQAHREVLVKRAEHLKSRAAKKDHSDERADLVREAMDLSAKIAKLPPIPSARLLADDTTPEALVGLLAANSGNVALLSAEGGLFDIVAGLYGDGRSNLDGLLKAHDGEPIRVDRRGREPEHIPRAVLTCGFAVQPTVIEGVMANTRFRGRGLIARFLFAVPESRVGRRAVAVAPLPAALQETYSVGLRAMLTATPSNGPAVLRCTSGALAAFDDFRREIEPRLHPDSGDLASIGDWAGKLPGTLARIAGLFHLAEHGGRAESVHVTEDVMNRALILGPYFVAHALAAFGMMGADAGVAGARRLLAWIRRKELTGFSARQVHNGLQRHFPRADDLQAPLGLLVHHNYIRQDPTPKGRNGRPPSPGYTVSPLWSRDGFVGSVSMYAGVKDENGAPSGGSESEGEPLHTDIPNIQNPPSVNATPQREAQPSNTDAQPINAGGRIRPGERVGDAELF